jgi:hypothetical protein
MLWKLGLKKSELSFKWLTISCADAISSTKTRQDSC